MFLLSGVFPVSFWLLCRPRPTFLSCGPCFTFGIQHPHSSESLSHGLSRCVHLLYLEMRFVGQNVCLLHLWRVPTAQCVPAAESHAVCPWQLREAFSAWSISCELWKACHHVLGEGGWERRSLSCSLISHKLADPFTLWTYPTGKLQLQSAVSEQWTWLKGIQACRGCL